MRKLKFFSMLALLLAIGQGAWADDVKRYNINKDGYVEVGEAENAIIEGTGETTSNQILIRNGATVTLRNVNISNVDYCILCLGEATIILEDGTENTLTGTRNYSALLAGSSGTLTIKGGPLGTGILNANGPANNAAIGGGRIVSNHICRNIWIEGGVINARGGEGAAAIGSDFGCTCGDITITGGIYTLDGRRLQAEPTEKGVYIVNGKKTIIK